MAYKYIDMNSYERKDHFEYFRSLQYPYVGVTVNVDVTGIVEYCKKNDYSFFLMFMHAVALAADEVKQLRQRIRQGKIVEYDECPTSHTELLDNGTYCYCTVHHHMDDKEYYKQALEARQSCKENGISEDDEVESMYFITSLPWINYTSLIQPVAAGDESNPRISWGKYIKDETGKYHMPVSILVHHGLVDGMHIGQFFENLDKHIKTFTLY